PYGEVRAERFGEIASVWGAGRAPDPARRLPVEDRNRVRSSEHPDEERAVAREAVPLEVWQRLQCGWTLGGADCGRGRIRIGGAHRVREQGPIGACGEPRGGSVRSEVLRTDEGSRR